MGKFLRKGILAVISFILLIIAASWALTCGVVKLITLCFGLKFSWAIATGIWLILWLLGSVFGKK